MQQNNNYYMENTSQDETEIDLLELLGVIRKHLAVIVLVTLAGAILAYLVSAILITPTYDSTTKIYVLNKQDDNTSTLTYSDLQSSTQLTKDYMELVTTRPVLEEVISELNLNMDYEDMVDNITTSTETDGRIISITATADSPQLAKNIADSVRTAVSEQIVNVMAVESVNLVEEANLPTHKARPSNTKNAALGGILALVIAVGIVTVSYLMDDRIKTEEDVEKYLHLSTLASIPIDDGYKSMKKKSMKQSKSAKRK